MHCLSNAAWMPVAAVRVGKMMGEYDRGGNVRVTTPKCQFDDWGTSGAQRASGQRV